MNINKLIVVFSKYNNLSLSNSYINENNKLFKFKFEVVLKNNNYYKFIINYKFKKFFISISYNNIFIIRNRDFDSYKKLKFIFEESLIKLKINLNDLNNNDYQEVMLIEEKFKLINKDCLEIKDINEELVLENKSLLVI